VRNHAERALASDLFVVVTAMFRILYVFVVLDVGTKRNSVLECDGTSDRRLDTADGARRGNSATCDHIMVKL
jgi:hypothetical protein